jgi:putative transposase
LKAQFPVAFLCQQLEVSRSSYYDWTAPSPARSRRSDLIVEIIDAFTASGRVAGYRKVTAALHRRAIPVNRKTVARHMRLLGLLSPGAERQFRRARARAGRQNDPVDLLGRDFSSITPGRVLVGDITYVPTREGWLYVATVIDLATRMVLGHATGTRQTAALAIRALQKARATGLVPVGAIFHSDHGVQYRSKAFARECGSGIRRSMGARYECWDNAVAESFFSKLKTERLDWITFTTRKAAATEVDDYITRFNTTRLHQGLGYRTPAERLTELQTAA